jgi:hypothetical protein
VIRGGRTQEKGRQKKVANPTGRTGNAHWLEAYHRFVNLRKTPSLAWSNSNSRWQQSWFADWQTLTRND